MILRSISTVNFRNLDPAEIPFHPSVNLLVGRNGQGKTNILEAIYFLATTKSFRTNRNASLFRFGEATIFATGRVERDGLVRTMSVGLETGETRKRLLSINEERVTLSRYVASLVVFAYSSARLETIRGVPEERRKFLDRGIASIDPEYLDKLSRYGRALKQRNALLAAVAAGEAKAAALEPWDDEFVRTATAVEKARTSYTAELTGTFLRILGEHQYHVAPVALAYRGSGTSQELREALEKHRRDELRARTSLFGPQRATLEFLVDGRVASEVLSGGEQKMLVLFLKFAKLELFRSRFEDPAIFVLDDIDAELDLEILQQLLLRLPAGTQVFATSAKERFLEILEAGPHRRLNIESGRVTGTRDF